jgi:hypothetical protein
LLKYPVCPHTAPLKTAVVPFNAPVKVPPVLARYVDEAELVVK